MIMVGPGGFEPPTNGLWARVTYAFGASKLKISNSIIFVYLCSSGDSKVFRKQGLGITRYWLVT